MTVSADPSSPDGFNVETHYVIARTGETVTRAGKSVVYTGFQWRGRGGVPGSDNVWREVMMVDRDWREMAGRWFTGAYDEIGIDVKLERLGSEPVVLGSDRAALKTASTAQRGEDLRRQPAGYDQAGGYRLRPGRHGHARRERDAGRARHRGGRRRGRADRPARSSRWPGRSSRRARRLRQDRRHQGAARRLGMARVGGVVFPKMLAQFEAMGTHNGPDGKPDTEDDIDLGMVDATWTIEEYTATYDDDDMKFVGDAGRQGAVHAERRRPEPASAAGNRNNIGDVWVVAELIQMTGAGKRRSRSGRARTCS